MQNLRHLWRAPYACITLIWLGTLVSPQSQIFAQTQPPTTSLTTEVNHVVLCWLKNPGNPEDIEKLIQAGKPLKQIEGILQLKVGTSIPSDRSIVDDSFDVGFYFLFANQEEMDCYLSNPIHLHTVEQILRPLTARILIYDF